MYLDVLFNTLFWYLGDLAQHNLRLLELVMLAIYMVVTELGFRIGARMRPREEQEAKASVGFAVGGTLALFGFLLGISLSMANSYYDARRASLLDEANALGTAWLRAHTVGGTQGQEIQRLLRDYTSLRLQALRAGAEGAERSAEATNRMQTAMWDAASDVARQSPTPISGLLLSSLNDAFDLATTNRRNFSVGMPTYVLKLLFVASVLSVGAMGYHFGLSGRRQLFITVLLLLLWSSAIVLIVDIAQPSLGQVLVDERPMVWTIQSFGPPPAQP